MFHPGQKVMCVWEHSLDVFSPDGTKQRPAGRPVKGQIYAVAGSDSSMNGIRLVEIPTGTKLMTVLSGSNLQKT